jgi:hypothetical protein
MAITADALMSKHRLRKTELTGQVAKGTERHTRHAWKALWRHTLGHDWCGARLGLHIAWEHWRWRQERVGLRQHPFMALLSIQDSWHAIRTADNDCTRSLSSNRTTHCTWA